MKPLLLEIQAFGPFAGREQVDFRALGAHALFLIHGPTGAGKTSLLDALSFVLYGESSGGERSLRHLRCDRAEAGTRTEVALEFALGPVRYRVLRTPRQDRPRARGAGVTEMMATATLDRWDGGTWQHLAAQPARVSELVEGLLGFDSAQFRQVIVLPQGKFRELLSASSATREQIFEQLFQTSLYRLVETQLKASAAVLKRTAEDLGERRAALLEQHAFADQEAVGQALQTLAEECLQNDQQLQVARVRAQDAQSVVERAEEDVRHLQAERSARAKCTELAAAQPDQDDARARLRAAQRALEIQTLVDAWRQTQIQARDAEQDCQRLASAEEQALAGHSASAFELQACALRAQEVPALQRQLASLEALQVPLRRWHALGAAQDGLRQRVQCSAESLRSHDASVAALLATVEDAERACEVARYANETVPALQHARALQQQRLERAQGMESTARRLAVLQRDLVERGTRLEVSAGDLKVARSRLLELDAQWLAGQAARLARHLQDGAACPVCGAHEHPAPASSGGHLIDDERLAAQKTLTEHAESVWQDARRRAEGLRIQCAEVEEQLRQAAALAGLSAALTAPDLERFAQAALHSLREAEAQLAQTRAHTQGAAELELQTRGLRETYSALQGARDGLQQTYTALQLEHALQARELELLEAQIPAAVRDPGAAEAAAVRVAQTLADVERQIQKARADERGAAAAAQSAGAARFAGESRRDLASAALRRAEQACLAALTQLGFADLADWEAAWRSAEQRAELDRQIRVFDDAWAAAQAALRDSSAAALGRAWPDMDTLHMARTMAHADVDTRLQALTMGAARHAVLTALSASLRTLADDLATIGGRFAAVGRLAEVANGANPRRMTFQRFVLATLLDEVLESASVRLLRMSRNRFSLQRVLNQVDQRSAGGLDIEVCDAETGTARPVSTLSGGEGFLASLSLALGLAQVVQTRTGGIRMETLFVDEGFGTLDPESLDFAMRTLIDLQREGRLVGIISHVAELRERIDVRLEVHPAAKGSRLVQAFDSLP